MEKKFSLSMNNLVSTILFGLVLANLAYIFIIFFNLIDKWVHKEESYAGNLSWTLAGAIVALALLALFAWVRNKNISLENRNTPLSRVFSFAMVVASAVGIIGVMLSVLYMLLSGITTETGPYVAAFSLVVFAMIFAIYFERIRDCKVALIKKMSRLGEWKVFGLALLAIVLALIFLNPRASANRERDMVKLDNLYTMQDQALYYYDANGKLPASMSDFDTKIDMKDKDNKLANYSYKLISNNVSTSTRFDNTCYVEYLRDGYSVANSRDYCTKKYWSGSAAFEVCADFNTTYTAPATTTVNELDYSYWNHGIGNQCFPVNMTTKDGQIDYQLKLPPQKAKDVFQEDYKTYYDDY